MPKYGNSAPGSQKWNFSKKFYFFKKASRFRFQRALNHPQTLSLSQVMQENILSKKLSLGLNFSTPSGGVTSPSLKGFMIDILHNVMRAVLYCIVLCVHFSQ